MGFTGWWFGTFGLFFHILGTIIPTDFHIFRGVETPSSIYIYRERVKIMILMIPIVNDN